MQQCMQLSNIYPLKIFYSKIPQFVYKFEHVLMVLGLIQPGEALYPSAFAVFVVLTCDFLPVLALPLYASVEKIDWTLAEAARVLHTNPRVVFMPDPFTRRTTRQHGQVERLRCA